MVMYLRMVLNFIISEPSRHFALRKEDEDRMPPRIGLSFCTKIYIYIMHCYRKLQLFYMKKAKFMQKGMEKGQEANPF